jgi:hypothetical protein
MLKIDSSIGGKAGNLILSLSGKVLKCPNARKKGLIISEFYGCRYQNLFVDENRNVFYYDRTNHKKLFGFLNKRNILWKFSDEISKSCGVFYEGEEGVLWKLYIKCPYGNVISSIAHFFHSM